MDNEQWSETTNEKI